MSVPAFVAAPAAETGSQRIRISDGTLEGLKWLGLVLMVLDHVNKYLFADAIPGAFEAGRLVMPLFGFVLAYNLARPGAVESGVFARVGRRLFIFGLIASPFFMGLGGLLYGWWPLNILFALLVSVVVVRLVERGGMAGPAAAGMVFVAGGAFVEFWWFAVGFVLLAWAYFKSGSKVALAGCTLILAGLYLVNWNLWALGAIPLMLAAPHVHLKVPRARHLFYAFYPAHLGAIWLVSKAL